MNYYQILLIITAVIIAIIILFYIFYLKHVNYVNKNLNESQKLVESFYEYIKSDNNTKVLEMFDKESVFLGVDNISEMKEYIKNDNKKYGKIKSYKLIYSHKPYFIIEENIGEDEITLSYHVKRDKEDTMEDFMIINKNNKYYIESYNVDGKEVLDSFYTSMNISRE